MTYLSLAVKSEVGWNDQIICKNVFKNEFENEFKTDRKKYFVKLLFLIICLKKGCFYYVKC